MNLTLLGVIVLAGIIVCYLGVCALVMVAAMRDEPRTFTDDDIDALTDAVVDAFKRDAAG